jgi:hypothetical protein
MNRRRMGRAICHCIGPDETDYVPLDKAKRKGWTVVDMKKDWEFIFPFEKKP